MFRRMKSQLRNRIAFALAMGLLICSIGFAGIFFFQYESRIHLERARTVDQMGHLLRASLENAMLKRDIEGLREIIKNFGLRSDIASVQIAAPNGEVRFSSLGAMPAAPLAFSPAAPTAPQTHQVNSGLLRSIYPVPNQPRCQVCHGLMADHPVNGYLVIDFDTRPWRDQVRTSLAWAAGAAVFVVGLTLLLLAFLLKRWVISPVQEVAHMASQLALGDLSRRTPVRSDDEIGHLAKAFNQMADKLEKGVTQLQHERQFLQAIVDVIPDGLRIIDSSHRIILVNQAFSRMCGYTLEELRGMCCYEASHGRTEPCPATLVGCPLATIHSTEGPTRYLQQFATKGGIKQVEVHAAPLWLTHEKAKPALIEICRDIDAQVEYSHEQRLSALGQLASGVAHEIRNPLSSIRLALQTILQQIASGKLQAADLAEYLSLVDKKIDNCVEITERLLHMSRYSRDTLELVEVNKAVSETSALVQYEAHQRGIDLILEPSPGNPRLIAAESDLRILILNLVQNAFHAMPNGGQLKLFTFIQDGEVVMGFQDDGMGVSQEDLPYIFDPFFSRRSDGTQGSGLGLAIVKSIVTKHGGSITVQSQRGAGSLMRVVFPLAETQLSRDPDILGRL